MGQIIENTVKITAEFAKGKRLAFFPKTAAEAERIQAAAFDLGFKWNDVNKTICYADFCVAKGMVLRDNYIFYAPKPASQVADTTYVCSADQMPESNPAKYYTDRQLMSSLFNKISERLDAIEAKVDAIAAEVQPRDHDKPSLKDQSRKP